MTDDRPVDRAFAEHDAFERAEEESGVEGTEQVVTTTPFDAGATARSREDGWWFRVVAVVPTLDAAVAGETVGPAVSDGWYETLSLRLEDAYDVLRADGETDPPALTRDTDDGEIAVEFVFEAADPRRGVDDAAALVDFVEGTYVQGVIPGYEYGDPVRSLVRRARRAGGDPTVGSDEESR